MTNSKSKGKRGELQAAKALSNVLGCEARRSQQYCGESGDADLITSIDGLHFEIKRVERGNPYSWLDQADSDARATETPVVLHRRNHRKWIAVIYLEDLPDLVKRITAFNKGTKHADKYNTED